jgi:hypothetical protein
MWPFAERSQRLEDLVGPTRIDAVVRVSSANSVTSPISGVKAAFVRLEALERVPRDTKSDRAGDAEDLFSLGVVLLGDLVTLSLADSAIAIELPVRRATLRLVDQPAGVIPVHRAVPELVPLFAQARRGGVLCQREHRVLCGDRLRLQAVVERTTSVVGVGYRSGAPERLVVRDDLAPVLLDEVLEAPSF